MNRKWDIAMIKYSSFSEVSVEMKNSNVLGLFR